MEVPCSFWQCSPSKGLSCKPLKRLLCNMQVLWHTAAAYARRLLELCPLGSTDMRERVAEKAKIRRAAEAAAETAKAEQAAKAVALRVASAG